MAINAIEASSDYVDLFTIRRYMPNFFDQRAVVRVTEDDGVPLVEWIE